MAKLKLEKEDLIKFLKKHLQCEKVEIDKDGNIWVHIDLDKLKEGRIEPITIPYPVPYPVYPEPFKPYNPPYWTTCQTSTTGKIQFVTE